MLKTIFRKIGKLLFWTLAGILLLVIILVLALQLGFVQRKITTEVEKIARNTLETDVGIGRIGLDIPSRVWVKDVYLNTPEGDSVARLGYLEVGVNMFALAQTTIELTHLEADHVFVNIATTDSTSSLAFLKTAFPADTTTATAQNVAPDTSTAASPWIIDAADATVDLTDIDIYYQDDPTGILADVVATRLNGTVEDIDLEKSRYALDLLELHSADALVNIGEGTAPADTTTSGEAAAMAIVAGRLTIEDSRYRMGLDSLEIGTELPYVNLEGGELKLGPELTFTGELFQIRNGGFRMDTPAPELAGPGMDFNHLGLTDIQAEATEIAYVVDSLHAKIRQLAGREKSGFVLEKTEGTVTYTPEFIGLESLVLRTENSRFESPATAVNYAFTDSTANLEEMVANVELNGALGLRDVALLVPDLRDIPVVGTNLRQQVTFALRAEGTVADMDIDRLRIDGPGVHVRARGEGQNLLDVERLGGRLTLDEFRITPGPLLPLVPEGLLPPDIDWPDRIVAEGTAIYRNETLRLDLYAIENRQLGNGMMSRVKVSGVVAGAADINTARLNLALDTLLASRATILAYVPPGSIPEDYTLPNYLRGSGTVEGPIDNLDVNLRLHLPGDSTFAAINGNIRNVTDPERLDLNVEVSDLAINIGDIEAILPDSLLPSNLNLPNLRVRNASISGTPTNLQFTVPLETDNGDWQLEGTYNPEDLAISVDIANVRVPELFTGALRDTLLNLELGPLDIQADVRGQLQPSMNLLVDAAIERAGGDSLLALNALVRDNSYAANFTALHPEFRAVGSGAYAIGADSVAKVEADIVITRLDLEYWEITQEPMIVEGSLVANSVGLDPYNLEAYALLDNVQLRGTEGSSYVDSLAVTASMHDNDNEVYVRSDVLDADLVGQFDPLKTPEKMVQFLLAYYDDGVRQPVPVENGERLDFTFELKRSQPLTGGLVNGLTTLTPFNMSLLYRDASPEFLFNLDLREIEYAGLVAHDLDLEAIGDKELFTWEADWSDISYNDQIELGRTELTGENVDGELLTELKLYADNDSLRHYLGFYVDPNGEDLTIRLQEEQILNFETWTVPATNSIALLGPDLVIRDIVLRNQEQLLSAETTEPGDVRIRFDDFQLSTPSRLIFSEEEVAEGTLNGTVGLNNVLTNLGIESSLTVDNFSWTNTRVGTIVAEVTTEDETTYRINAQLEEQGNNAVVRGTYVLNGPIDILADINRLTLESVEPFSLGYLEDTEGYVSGRVEVSGTAEAPRMNGRLSFNDASLIISLLGERFRLGDDPIIFDEETIRFGTDNFRIYDSQNNAATVTGTVDLNALDNIELDMQVVAEDFIAVNSDDEDNEDWYGFMSVDARVDISGTATLPVVDVTATTNENSEITYVYRLAEAGLQESSDVVRFVEQYRWVDVIRRDTIVEDTNYVQVAGVNMTIDLDIDPNLEVTVVVDPISGQTFVGRADGDLTLRIFPDGRQEAVGRVELVEGKYDFIYQQVINKEFEVLPGSNVVFSGDMLNPSLDLRIRHVAEASPLPLVQAVEGQNVDAGTLRRSQTFFVEIGLKGELEASTITTDVVYPEDAYGNLGLSSVDDALATLRQDESRMTTTAFQLLAFGGFNVPLVSGGDGGGPGLAATTLDNVMGSYLNNLADQYVGFVELDFGLDSYEDTDGTTNTNLRVSLRKTLFDDRIVISVDGVTGTDEDEAAGTSQAYLDNITAEYLINDDGTFRIKFFNDRDRDILVGGNVVRFGGRLTFGKDFNGLGWSKKK